MIFDFDLFKIPVSNYRQEYLKDIYAHLNVIAALQKKVYFEAHIGSAKQNKV